MPQPTGPAVILEVFMAEMQKMNALWDAVERNLIDKIIDPMILDKN